VSRKLTEAQLGGLRAGFVRGASPADLAVEFGVSERHVHRLVEGLEREPLELGGGSVEDAVTRFLQGRSPRLTAREQVTAEAALAVARRLDRADSRSAAGLANQLVDLVGFLRGEEKPDRIDQLIERRATRRLAAAVGTNGGAR
jgi:hypothetical protein